MNIVRYVQKYDITSDSDPAPLTVTDASLFRRGTVWVNTATNAVFDYVIYSEVSAEWKERGSGGGGGGSIGWMPSW